MKATMEIAARFTAPMSGMETGLAEPNRMTKRLIPSHDFPITSALAFQIPHLLPL